LIDTCEQEESIDILMVVKDQYDYVRQSIESIIKNSSNYHLYIWDNGSEELTAKYLQEVALLFEDKITLIKNSENSGFIVPNNRLAELGNNDYLILINSDTKVHENWTKPLVNFLKKNSDYSIVGYMGGLLNEEAQGVKINYGEEIDFVCGWCCCMSRSFYNNFGLFDEQNLKFAYCEDADLSLRAKEAGSKIYSLHLDLVEHYGSVTAKAVKEQGTDLSLTFSHNHNYMKKRWNEYLQKERVMCNAISV